MNQADLGILVNAPQARHRQHAVLLVNDSPKTAASALLLAQALQERMLSLDLGLRFCELLASLVVLTEFFPIYWGPVLLSCVVLLGAFPRVLFKPVPQK